MTSNDKYILDTFPRMLIVDTTDICNLTCKMCHQNSPDFIIGEDPHISMEIVKEIATIARDTKSIYLIGAGEPLMHPNIYEIIKLFKESCPGATVGTTSNGVLLNEKNLDKLIDSKIDNISFSMDGPNLERGHQKSEKTTKNLIRLSEKKKELGIDYPKILIGFVLGKDNENELLPIIEFAKSISASAVTIEPLRIIAPQKEWDDYIIANDPFKHRETIKPILDQARQLASKYGMELNTPYIASL